jgi:Ca-activated chloride channel family protein
MREYFSNPNMLWTLLVVPPALLLFFWWSWRKRQSLLTQFIQARLLPALTVGISPARQKIRLGCVVLAVVCLILALARPRWGFDWEDVKLRGLDIVVAIDTSKSMTAEDIAPNRLARAKLAALDLTRLAKADRLGLVAFAGGAFLQCPLTIDDAAFRQSVESLDVNTIPQGGTALADAIETSMTAFKEGDNHKILVLMTDGEDHDSGALKAAERAAKEGLHIYTIGIGTPEGEVLRVKDAQGKTDYVRDEQGKVVKSRLNEELLRQIAGATEGGFYLPLRGAKTIETLYQDGLARLPKSQHQEKRIKQYHERYHWPLAAAILLLLFEMVLPERKRERKAHAAPAPLRPAAKTAALLLCLAVSAGVGRASPASALKDYQKGNYPQALREYEKLLEREKDDPRLHFNAGAAAYRSRNFDEATKQFDAATATRDLQLQQRALFNRGNSLFRLGETTADPKLKTDQWERSLKDFEIASKLNQKDADAKSNHEFVKRKLEELKQQQQQQQQGDKNNKDDKQNQDQQNQQNQKGDQSKNDDQKQEKQKKQDQAQQNKSDQKQQDGQPDKSGQQRKEDEQKQASKQKQDQQKQQQQKQEQASQGQDQKDNSDEQQQQEAQAAAAGQMTPQQARQLLEAQKGDEQLMPAKPNGKPTDTSRALKDW